MAAPVMICEITNCFDSDGTILSAIENSQEVDLAKDDGTELALQADTLDFVNEEQKMDLEELTAINPAITSPKIKNLQLKTDRMDNHSTPINISQGRRSTDYIRREAMMRLKYLENKNRVETQILKAQLEVEEIKKRAALLDEERNKLLLEKAKLELDRLKKS